MRRPRFALLSLLLTASCATPSAAPSPEAAPSSAATLTLARAGCAKGLRDPNEKQFIARLVEKGAPPDAAAAVADHLFDPLDPQFDAMCDCTFASLGGWETVYREGQKSGNAAAWMERQLASPEHGPALKACTATLQAAIEGDLRARGPELKAFLQRWRAEHPQTP